MANASTNLLNMKKSPEPVGSSLFWGWSAPKKQCSTTSSWMAIGGPGTDRTASEFPAKGAGNPWQSCQSPEATLYTDSSWSFAIPSATVAGRNQQPPQSRRQQQGD